MESPGCSHQDCAYCDPLVLPKKILYLTCEVCGKSICNYCYIHSYPRSCQPL